MQRVDVKAAQVDYLPTLAVNAVYAAVFGLLMLVQLGLGIKFKTWGFMVGMICGSILEAVGYAGRIMPHDNPFNFINLITYAFFSPSIFHPVQIREQGLDNPHSYLIPLTIAPAFLAGTLCLCLSRIIIVYNHQISRFSLRTYAITFITCDSISLVLQGARGELAATPDDYSGSETGRTIMVVGVVLQVVSTSASAKGELFVELRDTKKFTWFQYALGAAVMLVFIRAVNRIAELQQAFNGSIANGKVSLMILERPMIFLAVLAMTVLHPAIAFGGKLSSAA
ncbi:hypothetical protein G7Z17_g4434 [Cylindrodendrum hubeiense]|uniref:RTA1 like protein n=1 Tax=Cylindrodendrum hubeiense TaxID=595255 RepID=A0A9P5HEY3_9HYPO|nr:hypothetical protein G7Z17_g4434 [Cylindrodendrum hubeiense]